MSGNYFLSYSRRDQEFALRLASDLRDGGATIWIDQADIQPSDRWDRAIESAVRNCIGVVVVLSPRSADSDHVLDEVAVALDAGKPVIPVLIEACQTPLRLARIHHIDATSDYESAVNRCRAAMDAASGGQQAIAPKAQAERPKVTVSRDIQAKVARLLIPYLGPISPLLTEEEGQGAASIADLAERLAARIPGAADKARFVAAVRALSRD